MRDNKWLEERFRKLLDLFFPDLELKNSVVVNFKGKWKNKFGHIKMRGDKSTEIVINSLFMNELVPPYIVDLTLAHELIHYMHGFQSPLKRLYRHPHKGGIVNKELKIRGFTSLLEMEREFMKNRWVKIYHFLTEYAKKSIS